MITTDALEPLAPRSDFPLLERDPALHYLDSAATAQKPRAVLDAVREFAETSWANPHRGAYALSVRATERYRESRERVARFVGLGDADSLIFTRGTTESLNLIAGAWGAGPGNVGPGDNVVVTRMDHHANFVTWQQLARARGAEFRIAAITSEGRLDLDDLARVVDARTRVVAFPHVSNALGTVNPLADIVALVRRRGRALIVCDGAQGVPHIGIDFDRSGVDFYAFSGHKLGAPSGIGALAARRELLESMPPWQTGGDMIEFVRDQETTWNVLPHKFEAGTPNADGAVGLAAACEYLDGLGLARVRRHEQALLARAEEALRAIPGVHIYGPPAAERSGVVSFTFADVHPHDLATVLDAEHVAIRAGHHCAQPLMRALGVSATARASFFVYNDEHDVDALARGVRRAAELFGHAGVA